MTKERWTRLILLVRYHDESKDMCGERFTFRYLKKILLQIGDRQTNKKLAKDFISLFTNGISNGKDVRPKDEGKAVKAPQAATPTRLVGDNDAPAALRPGVDPAETWRPPNGHREGNG
ncbi:unnamed protein product [Rangifer tarandus platyrhynchus]|uniref:Uncharacterized protein n=1 Tax=Rangifer tarandus platyrhynchus TaxID=3082113 RepID=A0ABN8Y716_RANTA|nr:unnamed protein product [Rangifer tarandus platyrhynchus]